MGMFSGNVGDEFKKHLLKEEANAKIGVEGSLDDRKVMQDVRSLLVRVQEVQGGDNKVLKNYMDVLFSTQGDYSRRSPKVLDKVVYMNSFVKELLSKDAELSYTIVGMFSRVFNLLKAPYFISTMGKVARALKDPETKDTATMYMTIYMCFAFFLEMMTIYLVSYEAKFANGMNPSALAKEFMTEHKGFTKSVGFGIASLVPILENQKITPSIVEAIAEEKTLAEARKKSEKMAKEDGGLTVLALIAIGVVSIVSILFVARNLFYWIANMKVDSAKKLELEAELLSNNIRSLKIQLANERDPAKKKKLEEVIAKQEAWVADWERRSKETLGDEIKASYQTEEDIQREESTTPAEKEAGKNDEIFL